MKKKIFYLLLTLIITGCDNKEEYTSKSQAINNPTQTYIINGDIEYISEITDGSKPKKPIFIYDISKDITENKTFEKLTSKITDESVDINFHYGLADPTKSGCTITKYLDSGKAFETDNGVYGPNAAPQTNGYLVRGFGVPHQNSYYGALVLMSSNRGKKVETRRGILHENAKRGSAISIEYAFKKNVTYEITMRTKFHDNRYFIDKVYSSGYPTLYVQLKDDAIITLPDRKGQIQNSCDREDLNDVGPYSGIGLYDNDNYTRTYSPDNHIETIKDISFQFSPIDEKKALLISLYPTLGTEGYELPIPTNSHTMILLYIKITEKPFNPFLNFEIKKSEGGRR